jgi:cytochrome c556
VLEALLRESGFADIELATVRAPFQVASVDDALAFMQQAAGAYRAVIADLSEAGKAAAWAEVRDGLEKFKTASGFEVEMEFIIGSGAVPA